MGSIVREDIAGVVDWSFAHRLIADTGDDERLTDTGVH